MRMLATIAVTMLLAAPRLGAQLGAQLDAHRPGPDPLLSRLIGRWVLRGPMAGSQVVHDVTFRWVLDSEYVEMHELSRERSPTGRPAYEAIVYIGHDPRSGVYSGLWMDNTAYGAFAPAGLGRARAAGDSIPFVFVSSPTVRFHNTFVYDRRADRWAWHLDDDSAGVRRPFARVTLTRQ